MPLAFCTTRLCEAGRLLVSAEMRLDKENTVRIEEIDRLAVDYDRKAVEVTAQRRPLATEFIAMDLP